MNPLNAALAAIDLNAGPDMALMRAKARALMVGYHERWKGQQYKTVSVEETLTADLMNPATGKFSRSFAVAGKLDVRAVVDGRCYIVDHKTTGDDIEDPLSPFWRQLSIEGQISHYFLLEWCNGRKPDGAVWDVVKKPTIAPRQISKAEMKELTFSERWFGLGVTDDQIAEAQTAGRESFGLYELRLVHDCTVERPARYFQRRTIPRMDSEIMEYARELWDHGQDLLVARRTGRMPRNGKACMNYGHPCKFLPLCSGSDDTESGNWQQKDWAHDELPVLDGDVLTNSRIGTWQTCRRLHKLKYEDRLDRVDAEEREALQFGTLWHHAQAAWWECFKPELKGQNHHGNADSGSANSVEHASA